MSAVSLGLRSEPFHAAMMISHLAAGWFCLVLKLWKGTRDKADGEAGRVW